MPRKNPDEFPLWWHTGANQWCKWINGRLIYFGAEKTGALEQYARERPAWQVGSNPRVDRSDDVTVSDCCNWYLEGQDRRKHLGEIAVRTFDERRYVLRHLADIAGTRHVSDLRPMDWASIRDALAKRCGPTTLPKWLTVIRSAFDYCYQIEVLATSVRFGPEFRGASRKVRRKVANARSSRLYTPAELRQILAAASRSMRAFVLLGINGGMGAADIGALRAEHLQGNWLVQEREKTAILRRIPLWQETVKAVDAARTHDQCALFVTDRGGPWYIVGSDGSKSDFIGAEFAKLLGRLNLKRRGVGFYALRAIFRTIADELPDQRAINAIMGHTPNDRDMSAHYVESIDDSRLLAVTEHVRHWLFV